jgi:hypothetical protein
MSSPESISTRFIPGPVTRVMNYEIRSAQDTLDYLAKAEGVTTKQIALDMKISRRRIQQIWKSMLRASKSLQSARTWADPGAL